MPRDGGYTATGFGRPDGSSPLKRGDGRQNRPVSRGGNYPYDRGITYGMPRSTGMDGEGYLDFAPQHQIVPKDTRHTPWDDETGELGESYAPHPFRDEDDAMEQLDVFMDMCEGGQAGPRDVLAFVGNVAKLVGILPPPADERGPPARFYSWARAQSASGQSPQADVIRKNAAEYLEMALMPAKGYTDVITGYFVRRDEEQQANSRIFDLKEVGRHLQTLCDISGHTYSEDLELDECLRLLDEASGTPYMLGKASDPSSTSAISGVTAGWASAPWEHGTGPDNDGDEDDDAMMSRKRRDEMASAWDMLDPSAGMGAGMDPCELELDTTKRDFRSMFDASLDFVDDMPSRDLVSLLIDVDPDYAADALAPEDDEDARQLYIRWGDHVAGSSDDDDGGQGT